MTDPHQLQRFVDAQAEVFDSVREELQAGRKRTHWMWFIFPQLRGLGSSPMAYRYGIASLAEASAYLQHPLLGARLIDCTQLATQVKGRSVTEIFGSPDDLKFHSSMTLFCRATSENLVFQDALARYFQGQADPLTLERLAQTLLR